MLRSLVLSNSVTYSNLEETCTKREVVQVIGSLFDLLGYYSPTVLRAELFMKMLWKEGCEWDAKLDTDKLTTSLEILEDLKTTPDYSIQRYLGFLHGSEHFADLPLFVFAKPLLKHTPLLSICIILQ